VSPDVLKAISQEFAPLALMHHLALVVLLVIFWIRREGMARAIGVYFAVAFATACAALATRPETRTTALVSAALAALWLWSALGPKPALSFSRTPRLRLWIMGGLGLFGFAYPGYAGELPAAFFAPLGVTLSPTTMVALALQNSASASPNRIVHWALAATGLALGGAGLVLEGWIHAPLIAISAYAIALLLGAGKLTEERRPARERSVREIRDRMYARKTILRGPRDPRRRRLNVRRRRR
jgi:hypothetical protein